MRNRWMRRWLVLVCAGMLALTACTGQGRQQEEGDSEDGPVTVAFWNGFTGPDRAAVEGLVKQYNESQDEVEVQMEISPWDVFFQKLLPSIAAGKGPDLMAMDSVQLPQYASRGVLEPLDGYYDDQENEADALVSSAVDATEWEGERYGVPMNFTTLLLYWNKDMFEEAGLDPESPPADWEEFEEAAKKTTIDENGDGRPEQYGLAIADHATIAMWPILFWGNGGGVVNEDGSEAILGEPETIEAMDRWGSLVRDDKVAPIGLAGADADKLFQSKKAAMEIVGPWMTTGFEDAGIDFGLAPPPEGPAGPVTLGTSVSFAVNSKTSDEQKEAAQDFVKFWNSQESQVYWSLNSGFPPNRTDIDEAELSENPYVAQFAGPADQARFYLGGVKEFSKVNETIFEPALQKVLNGEGTAEEIFTEADQEIQSVLDSQ
jgi:multiple sugar transport system substrate-binding protein